MCGIIKVKLKKGNGRQEVIDRYQAQCHRGEEGFGYFPIYKNGIIGELKQAEDEKDIMKMLNQENAREFLFHHRYPTSTPNFIEATHTILVDNPLLKWGYYVVHNGVISNPEMMKPEHEKLGFKYHTSMKKQYVTQGLTYTYDEEWNDSESFAIDFALYIEGKQEELESMGRIAFIVYQYDKETRKINNVFYGRNHKSPLVVEETKQGLFISSENKKQNSREVVAHKLHTLDWASNNVTIKDLDIGDLDDPSYKKKSKYNGNSISNSKNTYYPKSSQYDDYISDYLESMTVEDIVDVYPEINSDDRYLELLIEEDSLIGLKNQEPLGSTSRDIYEYDIKRVRNDLLEYVREYAFDMESKYLSYEQ